MKGNYITVPYEESDEFKNECFTDLRETIKEEYGNIIDRIDSFVDRSNTNFAIPAEINGGVEVDYSWNRFTDALGTVGMKDANMTEINLASKFEQMHSGYFADSNILVPLRADLENIRNCFASYDEMDDVVDNQFKQSSLHNAWWKDRFALDYSEFTDKAINTISRRSGMESNDTISHQDKLAEIRLKKALKWLIEHKLPVNTVKSLITSKMRYYSSLLTGTINKRANIAAYYLTYVPNTITRYMYEAQNYMLKPFYEFVYELPEMPNEVDEVLDKILNEAERAVRVGVNSSMELLKLSKMEQDISKKRLDFMKEVNEFYNINTVLQSVENVKII